MHLIQSERPLAENVQSLPFRMVVQQAVPGIPGHTGAVVSGTVRTGDKVRIVPLGHNSTVSGILTEGGEAEEATAGQSVTLVLADPADCVPGNVIATADDPPQVSDQFEATVNWQDRSELLPGRSYLMELAGQTVTATIGTLKHQLDPESGEELPATKLAQGSTGVLEFSTDDPVVFEPHERNLALGGFILIDRITNAPVAEGHIHFSLRRAQNIHWQATIIDRDAHARLKNQKPMVLWFTGLSGSGKSTIANEVEKRLHAMQRHTFLLDGDNVRHGLNKDLGFTDAARVENIRRVGEVAKLMVDAGLIVLTAFISPFRAERRMVRDMLQDGEFVEIFVDTPLEVAEQRDVKGLYKKARAGELKNFTGIDSPYEAPGRPEIRVNTIEMSPAEAAEQIVDWLTDRPD